MTAGQTVGGYRLLRVIGEGGMGVVHLALDASDRAVAVKIVRPHVAADPETRARLAREVRSLLRVRHPRVAEVLDADFDAELPYVVMRYVPGEPLDAVVRRDGPLSGPLLDELAVGLFEAVAAVHAVGVVHRDLKPGNVLLLDGSPVVIDFGIARALDDVSLTSTGLMVGTPGYLSPEVLDGTDVGTAADWWGWGAVVAYAATGRAPFRGGPLEAVWDRVRRGAADLEGVPEPWARVLAATLRPDPSARPSPEQLGDAVTRLTGRRPELPAVAGVMAAAQAATTRTQPRPGPAVGSGAAASGATGTPATTVQRRPEPGPPETRRGQDVRPAARAPVQEPATRVVQRPGPPSPPADRPPATRPAARAADAPTAPQPALRRADSDVAPTAPLPVQTVQSYAPGYGTPTAGSYAPPFPSPTAAVQRADAPRRAWPAQEGVAPPAPQPHRPGASDGRGPADRLRAGGPGSPVGPLPHRRAVALLGLLVVAAVAVVTPPGGAVLVLLWAAVARSVQWSRVAAAMSRARTGRLGAGARTGLVLAYPFRLLGSLVASAAYLLVGALVVSPLLLAGAAVLLRGVSLDSWTTVQALLLQNPVPSVLVVVAALLAWLGPGGRAVRHGSRALSEPVARHRNGRLVLAGLAGLVVVAAVLVVSSRA